MIYVRAAIITTLLLITALFGYIYFTFDATFQVNIALESFLKGDYSKAEKELQKISRHLSPDKKYLYEAYIFREQNEIGKSNEALSKSLEAQKDLNSQELYEIYVNLALNDYLSQDDKSLKKALTKAKGISANNPWNTFFDGLHDFLIGNYPEAIERLQNVQQRQPLSPWMKKAFEDRFSSLWETLMVVRLRIEEGKFVQARQTLEIESKKAKGDLLNQIYFLQGLSYIKEANEKPANVALPYYKLALSYFNRIPFQQEQFSKERESTIEQFKIKTNELIKNKEFTDLPFYVAILENWGARSQLASINNNLINALNEETTKGQWKSVQDLINVLNRILPEGSMRLALANQFENLSKEALEEGKTDRFEFYWEKAQQFNSGSQSFKQEMLQFLHQKIATSVSTSDFFLSKPKEYIKIWQNIENDEKQRLQLSEELTALAEALWNEKGQEEKVINLVGIALSLPLDADRGKLHSEVEHFFEQAYHQSLKQNQLDKIPYILEAQKSFNFQAIQLQNKNELLGLLNEAKSLLEKKDLVQAKQQLEWLLQGEPYHQEALRLMGFLDYQEANYKSSLKYLKQLAVADSTIQEAIAVSEVFDGDSKKGYDSLNNLALQKTLSSSAYIHLGFGFLSRQDPDNAMKWFYKINSPNNIANIGLMLSYYQKKEWQSSIDAFHRLTGTYQQVTDLQVIALEALMHLKQTDEAEKLIQKILQPISLPENQEDENGMLLKTFLNNNPLGSHYVYYVVGLFFKNVKNDNQKALEYFDKIEKPFPELLILRAEIFIALQDYNEAEEELQKALKMTKSNAIKQLIYPLLSVIYAEEGLFADAFHRFQEFYKANPLDWNYRDEYALTLIQLHLYDLAVEQYELLATHRDLKPQEILGYIDSLIRTNKIEKGIEEAKRLLIRTPPIPLVQRLKLSQLMERANAQQLIWSVLQNMPKQEQMSEQEIEELIAFLIEIGAYAQASSFANSNVIAMEKSVRGLLLLAELNERLSNHSAALSFAHQAQQLNPHDLNVKNFLTKYDDELAFIEPQVNALQKKVDVLEGSISEQLIYVRNVINWVRSARQKKSSSLESANKALQRSYYLLDKFLKIHQRFPEAFFLMGEVYDLMEKKEDAINAYLQALQLDPSYADAYKNLAINYQKLQKTQDASGMFKLALKFDPQDSESWIALADLQIAQGNLFEAISSLLNAIKFHPQQIAPYVKIAKLYLEIQNPEDAKTSLEYALTIEPQSVELLKQLLQILYDSTLEIDMERIKGLEEDRKAIYQRLYQLDPKGAKEIMSQLKLKPASKF